MDFCDQGSPDGGHDSGSNNGDGDDEGPNNSRRPIESLTEAIVGITRLDVNNLRANGIETVGEIAFVLKRHLLEIPGITGDKADKLLKYSLERAHNGGGFTSALELALKEDDLIFITTGSKAVDKLFTKSGGGGGGIETQSITEIVGPAGSGKTQLCHTLAITCQLDHVRGGARGKCMYIDTKNSFRPQRLKQIAIGHNLDPKEALRGVAIAKCYNTGHQYQLLLEDANQILANGDRDQNYCLLIVDSATHLFKTEFLGLGNLASRQQNLARFIRVLRKFAEYYKIACVITNEMVTNPTDQQCDSLQLDGVYDLEGAIPACGNIIAHAATTRLLLRKRTHRSPGERRKGFLCRVLQSPSMPPNEAPFDITETGIVDYNINEFPATEEVDENNNNISNNNNHNNDNHNNK